MFNCLKSKNSPSIAPIQHILKPGDIIHVWENKKPIKSVTIGEPESIKYHVVSPLQSKKNKDNFLPKLV